jgi:copper chaperone CopZ
LPGIHEIKGDLAAGILLVTYNPTQVTPEQIIEKIEAVGYSVEGTFEP